MTKPTLTTLSRTEAQTLQNFIYKVDDWQSRFGEKANKVEITYYPEDDGFEFANGEENNGLLKRNRTTAFRAEMASWAVDELSRLTGWNNQNSITAFIVSFKNGEYGVKVATADKQEQEIQVSTQAES